MGLHYFDNYPGYFALFLFSIYVIVFLGSLRMFFFVSDQLNEISETLKKINQTPLIKAGQTPEHTHIWGHADYNDHIYGASSRAICTICGKEPETKK